MNDTDAAPRTKMRAWQVQRAGEPSEVLALVHLDVPEPGPDEVRIRVGAATLGLPDVFMCRGFYPLTPPLPFVAGQEVAGVVSAAGPGAAVAVGTRIMGVTAFTDGRGGFADETIVPARSLHRVPEGMSDPEAAAFFIAYHTAWIGLVQRADIKAGDELLVLGGAGGSGAAAIQLGHALGAHVVATAAGPERAEFCRQQGADIVIDHRSEAVADAIRSATGGHGADIIYDVVGGDLARESLNAVANEGQLLLVGFASGSWVQVSPAHAVRRNYAVVGVYAGAYDRGFNEQIHEELLSLYAAGRITVPVTRTVPFERLPFALDELAQRSSLGRTVMVPAQ